MGEGRSQNCEKRVLTSSCLYDRPSAWIGSVFAGHISHFHEILYMDVFRKSAEKIQVSQKSDKHAGYFS